MIFSKNNDLIFKELTSNKFYFQELFEIQMQVNNYVLNRTENDHFLLPATLSALKSGDSERGPFSLITLTVAPSGLSFPSALSL